MQIRWLTPLLLTLMLSACSIRQDSVQPLPPVSDSPQEIKRSQTHGLVRMGTVTTFGQGAPSDMEAALKVKAAAQKADYYVIVLNDETVHPGQRYALAILYHK